MIKKLFKSWFIKWIDNIFVFYLADKCKADHTTSQQPEKEAHCSNQRVLSN